MDLRKLMKVKMDFHRVFICILIIPFLIAGCHPNKNKKTASDIKTDSTQIFLTNSENEYKLAENEINKLYGVGNKTNQLSKKMMLELVEKRNALDRLITNNPQDTLIKDKMKDLEDYRIRCTQIADSILLIYKK